MLRDFFLGELGVKELVSDLGGVRQRTGHDTVHHLMEDDLEADFEVEPKHLISLCEAVLSRGLDPQLLEAIAFGMFCSEHFVWSEDSSPGGVDETIGDWSAPEVNYALRRETVEKFKERLRSGENTFTAEDTEGRPLASGRVVWNNPRSK